jgi:hypothetical protein
VEKISWSDFRGKVLGPTDPADAPTDSLRGIIMADWKKLGLASEPNTGDNGVHASASPFEATAELNNWLSQSFPDTKFGASLLAAGVSEATIKSYVCPVCRPVPVPPAVSSSNSNFPLSNLYLALIWWTCNVHS